MHWQDVRRGRGGLHVPPPHHPASALTEVDRLAPGTPLQQPGVRCPNPHGVPDPGLRAGKRVHILHSTRDLNLGGEKKNGRMEQLGVYERERERWGWACWRPFLLPYVPSAGNKQELALSLGPREGTAGARPRVLPRTSSLSNAPSAIACVQDRLSPSV